LILVILVPILVICCSRVLHSTAQIYVPLVSSGLNSLKEPSSTLFNIAQGKHQCHDLKSDQQMSQLGNVLIHHILCMHVFKQLHCW